MKTTFKDVISEARNPDLKYKEKVVKNKVDRVTVELAGSDSATITKLATRFERLQTAMELMGKKRAEINDVMKGKVEALFDAEDIVLTRVVETAAFSLTLSKRVAPEEQDPKTVVDYKSIATELAALISDDLQEQVNAIVKKYTEVSIAQEKAPALRVKAKVTEGVMDVLKNVTDSISRFVKSITSWAKGYDNKLNGLKKRLA